MTFNSWEFILFYPLVLLLYFVLPKRAKWPMLLFASYFFYMCYQPQLVFLIFGTTLISWAMSNVIEKSEKLLYKRLALAATLISSLGVLFFYKYFDFLSETIFDIASLFGYRGDSFALSLMLPVGISFYTFQTLSYVIDVYRGDVKTEKNFFFYALFVSFFPQLVAGPIERPGNLIPQLKEEHKWDNGNAIAGGKMMIIGFFKKICVADLFAGVVNSVYNNPSEASAIGVIIATILFAVQIYCDFSGYTDIAIGCARIMGIRLMKNFDRPYCATSIKEFWSRWHISLSSWFRDYLYIPLGGNRVPKWRNLLNLFIVFLVSGLWHGAAWTFVLWGALHGVYQIVGKLTINSRNNLIHKLGYSENSKGVIIARRIITFILVDLAWLLFRANSIGDAAVLLKRLFVGWDISIVEAFKNIGLSLEMILLAVFSLVILFFFERMVTYDTLDGKPDALVKNGSFIYSVLAVVIVWCLLLSKDMISTFIYFQF